MAGFGPAREGVKVPCLTAWLHPCIFLHRLRHCAPFESLTQRPNHTIAATTPHPLNASALAQSVAMPVSHGTFQPCAGMSVASVSFTQAGASPINILRPAAFIQRTGKPLASLGTFAPMFVCLSRLSPLRVGCLRLAPIGTRFCCPAAPISGQPVCECTSHGAGCGADGWT